MGDVSKYKSKWQLKDDETFRIRFALDEGGERVTFVQRENKDIETHWAEFKMWDYSTMVQLRKAATIYNKESGSFYVDTDRFNDLKIRYLLRDWSFGHIDPQMKIHHNQGMLIDSCFEIFKSLYPCVVNEIITRMNTILEGYDIDIEAEVIENNG